MKVGGGGHCWMTTMPCHHLGPYGMGSGSGSLFGVRRSSGATLPEPACLVPRGMQICTSPHLASTPRLEGRVPREGCALPQPLSCHRHTKCHVGDAREERGAQRGRYLI